MPKSMTGFGRGEYVEEGLRISIEIKSVNHRYNEINVRLPRFLNAFEDKIRKAVANQLNRGKVDVYISWQDTSSAQKAVAVNTQLASKYFTALTELSENIPKAAFNVGIHQLALYPDVLQLETTALEEETAWSKLYTALNVALGAVDEMRCAEGGNLSADIMQRANVLQARIDDLQARAPGIVHEHREKLLVKMRDLFAEMNIATDEARVFQEAAVFAERTNFTEELVRLSSHTKQFAAALQAAGNVGKKLDFLIQEINREINTCGSKCNDFEAASIVVELKSELEKIREQVQNIE